MIFKQVIQELKGDLKTAPDANKDRIRHIIELYQDKKIANSRTALHVVSLLACKNKLTIKSGRAIKEYDKVVNKYQYALPTTGRLKREADENARRAKDVVDSADIVIGDLEKVRTKIEIKFKKQHDGPETRSFHELIAKQRARIYNAVSQALERKQSMKIKMRLELTYKKPNPGFDGDMEYEVKPGHLANLRVHQITKASIKKGLDQQISEMIEKVETLEPKGSKTGSGWIIQSFDSLYVDIYETKQLRGSSYIPTPARY